MSHLTLINHFGSPSTGSKCIYTMHPNPFTTHQPPLDHSHSLYQPRDSHHTLALRLFTLFYQTNQPTLPAHAPLRYSYRLINNQRQDANLFDFLNSTRCCWVCCSCSCPRFQHGQWSRSEDRFWTSPTIRLSSHGRLEGTHGESSLRWNQGCY